MDRNEGVVAIKEYSPWSLSARRAWIEMQISVSTVVGVLVALRKESVDRNYSANAVDQILPVALRKESVDRNYYFDLSRLWDGRSLSARRAWIEIAYR